MHKLQFNKSLTVMVNMITTSLACHLLPVLPVCLHIQWTPVKKKKSIGGIIWHVAFACLFQLCSVTHTDLFGDVAILINVIEVEGPVELLSDWTSEQHRQADDEILKADWTISVDVKRVEQEVSVRSCIWGQKQARPLSNCGVFCQISKRAMLIRAGTWSWSNTLLTFDFWSFMSIAF